MKINDINGIESVIKIRSGKGKKDRYIPLPEETLLLLRNYYKIFKPKDYLFNGQNSETYSDRSCENILKNAAIKAGIKKRVHLHMIRHSRATHWLDNGMDIFDISKLLGHASVKTTMIYIHTSMNMMKEKTKAADERIKNRLKYLTSQKDYGRYQLAS